jgi:RHS repeat-associated protein
MTDALGNTTRYGWTPEGLLAWRMRPGGGTERWSYDGEGNQISYTDVLGQTATTTIGAFDLPTITTDVDGRRTVLAHDSELRLTAVTNANGQTWSYGYDAAGRLTAETDFSGRTVHFGYDAAGRLTEKTNASGQRVTYERDAAGEIVGLDRDGEAFAFTRDSAGRITRAIGGGVELTREYDPRGRLLSETTDGRAITFAYDLLGRRVGRRTPAGVDSGWEYGPVHELPVALHAGGQSVRFGYDAAGREVARRLGPELLFTQTWDADSRLRELTVTGGLGDPRRQRLVERRSYAYRGDGYPTAVEDQQTGRSDFALDPAGRVTAVTAPGRSERYAYDALGTPTWPERGRYEYDADGRVVTRTERTLSGQVRTWRYAWNADDQLTDAHTPDGAHWRYRYDPLGRRIGKERAGGEERTVFCWDGNQLVEQTTPGRTTTWEYRPGTYQPVAQLDRDEVDRRFCAIVTDLVGAPTELVTPDGELAWRQRGTVWGTAYTGGGTDCPLRFPGQYLDAETGLHYNLARHYDPATGRYVTADPLGLVAGPDPHAYARNPLTWQDPLGLKCTTVYRQLSAADREAFDRGEGLVAKGTSRDIAEHIRGGDTRHISASLTEAQAGRFASGNGLVAIDVDEAIRGGSRFVDHGNVMQAAGRAPDASRLKPFAERAGEVLFIDQIPHSAMTLIG